MRSVLRLLGPALVLLWINAYICRDFFHSGYTGHNNSMQGFWAGLARLGTSDHWLRSAWWPYHDAGSPFEWTYAPVVPGFAALWSFLAGVEPIRGLQTASGVVYCLGPVTLFLFCAMASRRILWSFAAAVAYSLLAPTEWVVPDGHSTWRSIADARRLYLLAVWDETPHYAAVVLLPLVLLFLARAMETGRMRYWLLVSLSTAASLMTSAFGATSIALGTVCLLLAFGRENFLRNFTGAAVSGAVGWLLAVPSLPPSLIATIRTDAALHGDSGWNLGALTAVAITAAGVMAVLVLCDRYRAGWWARFVFLFAWVMTAIPVLAQYLGRHFLPQPGRYKVEAELALSIAAVFGAAVLVRRFPVRLRAALALVGLALAAEGVVKHRRYEKQLVRDRDITGTIEYRTARWAAANLSDARIALPGSLSFWFNTWVDNAQFTGSSYSTAYNPVQQRALAHWLAASTPAAAADALVWLKAFGTYAFAVPGPDSGEFWKALTHPELFLPCEALWSESNTTVCQVPGARRSIAHVLPANAVVTRRPSSASDTAEVRRYAAALDAAGEASVAWSGTDAVTIRGNVPAGQIVSAQVSWHPGWTAEVGGREVPLRPDGLGLMSIEPGCSGPCEIRLSYDGGAELAASHIVRWTTAGFIVFAMWRRRTRRVSPGRGRGNGGSGESDIT